MELIVCNATLDRVGLIEELTSLVWTRRYQTVGDLSLLVPYRDDYAALLVDGALLLKRGGTEAMEICYRHISKDEQGVEQIEVQGHTLMSWLDHRVMLSQIKSSSLTGQAILLRHLIQNITAPADAARAIPLTDIYSRADYGDAAISDYASEEHAVVRDSFESLLADSELGFRVITSTAARKHSLDVFRGRDLTTGQRVNNPCIFSVDFDTLGEQNYTHGTEALRTTAYVYGGDNGKMILVDGGLTGLARREIAVEASDITRVYTDDNGNSVTLTVAKLNNALTQRGKEELKKCLEEQTFEGKLNVFGQTKYGTDFDIGDRVTCISKRWGVSIDVTITEVSETYQGNKTELVATFGDGTPSLSKMIRQAAKR